MFDDLDFYDRADAETDAAYAAAHALYSDRPARP